MAVVAVIYPDAVMEMLRAPEAVAATQAAAEACVQAAKQTNPERTGRSSSQIATFQTTEIDGAAATYFGSSSPIWHILEFGSVKNPPFRALTTACERVGIEFRPS
jgi:hypothetical protein